MPQPIGQAIAIILAILCAVSLVIAGVSWYLSGSWVIGLSVLVVLVGASLAVIRFG